MSAAAAAAATGRSENKHAANSSALQRRLQGIRLCRKATSEIIWHKNKETHAAVTSNVVAQSVGWREDKVARLPTAVSCWRGLPRSALIDHLPLLLRIVHYLQPSFRMHLAKSCTGSPSTWM